MTSSQKDRPSIIKVAAAQYPIDQIASFLYYEDKITKWVGEAAAAEAKLLVFPEYSGWELVSLFPEEKDLASQMENLQTFLQKYIRLFSSVSQQFGLHILAGTFPVKVESGTYRNRAYFFGPNGSMVYQDKLIMTRFEKEKLGFIQGDHQIKIIRTEFGSIGINICYDVEFPFIARKQALAGAEILLVPSCTDSLAGYSRVRVGCRARALENQFFVVQSTTVGTAPWTEALDENVGSASIFFTPENSVIQNGVLAGGNLNEPGWVYADVDLSLIRQVRSQGQTLNHLDWELHEKLCDRVITEYPTNQ